MFQTEREFRQFKRIIQVLKFVTLFTILHPDYMTLTHMSIKEKTYIYSIVRHLRQVAHPELFLCVLKGLTVRLYIMYV